MFWWNEAVEVIEATEAVEAIAVIEAAEVLRPEKSLLITEDIKVPEFSFIWCFENKYFLLESWDIKLNFGTF